ncbi:MAG: hydroxyisourate hydrolase [Bacteriovoracaceae bacterium]|nr:hydroxyisourate hydrolase [Bacteriovoracaceae bacterium]
MISTHILDTSRGLPAANVKVVLEKKTANNWNEVGSGVTNTDGRHAFEIPYEAGDYRLTFMIEDYFKNQESFFLNTPVVFRVSDTKRKYHVPLLLNPYGLSTYRGS